MNRRMDYDMPEVGFQLEDELFIGMPGGISDQEKSYLCLRRSINQHC